ncbi:hypothetical protein G9A89_022000 [Geosiphon pyriformis]|nr:hypothetical protein G9A89_022000 [Geosiphon pyriformis]
MAPTEELTKENWKQWTEQLPISYYYYQLGQKLNIQELYINKSKRIFNQNIIQQIKEFIGKKMNSTLHVRTIYQLHNIFQNYPKILLHSDIETITINQWGRINNTQIEDMKNRVEQTILEKEHRALLYTLPIGTNAHDIWDFIGSVGEKTCVINQHSVTYVWARCVVVCFDSATSINAVMGITSVLKDANLCGNVSPGGPTRKLLSDDNKSRLASIYTRHSASISCPVSFGGVLWANIVGRFSFLPLPVCNSLAASSSSSEIKPTPVVSMELNDRFATLEHSLASLAECIDKLAKKLDSLGPTVSQSSSGLDIVMSEGSGVATSGETIAGVVVFDSLVISKMEETLNNLSIIVMDLSAKMDNVGLVSAKIVTCNICGINVSAKLEDIIMNKFDGVRIFFSGLDKRFFGTGVAIIMNNFLTCHVFKVEEIPGYLVSVQLLFKSKLLVVFLGLYTSTSAETRFGQVCEINFFIAKAANSSALMVLDRLVNSFSEHSLVKAFIWGNFWSAVKIIDYIFVSKSLLSALAGHEVTSVSDFFNTDYNAILISVGLSGFLNAWLNSKHKQTNKDKWKFKIKDMDANKWAQFRKHSLDKFLEYIDMFNNTKVTKNLDVMWGILREVITSSADSVFSRHWFSEFDCLKNKWSSKFFKLELLVTKLVKCLSSDQDSKAVYLFKVWSILDNKKASKAYTMFDNNKSRKSILLHLLKVKKLYQKSKYYEFRVAKDISIKKAIDKCMETFSSNKEHMIKSVLDQPFKKVVLNYLVVDDELILEPKEVKSAVDSIMKG